MHRSQADSLSLSLPLSLSLFRNRHRCQCSNLIALLNMWFRFEYISLFGRMLCSAESPRRLEFLELACNMAASDSESNISGVDETIIVVHPSPFRDPTTGDEYTNRNGVFSICQPTYCLLFSLSPPLPSFWPSVNRAIVFFSRLLPFPLPRRQGSRRLH